MTTILQINETSDTLLVPSVIVPENRLTLIELDLASLTNSLGAKVSQSAFDTLSNTVDAKVAQSSFNAFVTLTDTNLGTKANQTDFDALAVTVGTKANQTDFDALAVTVGTKASQGSVNQLSTDVAALAGDVALKVSQLSFNNVIGGLNTDIASKASQASLNALAVTVGQLETSLNGTVTTSQFSTLQGRVTTLEGDYTTLLATIGTKANQSDLETLSGTVDGKANQSDLETLSGTVDGKANQSDLDTEIARIDVIDEFVSEEQSIFGTTYNGLMIYGIVGGTFNGDKIVDYETIDGVKSGERTTAMPTVGTFYNTDVPGTYSGETRRHVFRKEFNGSITEETAPRVRKITAGPDDATFITEELAGEVIVSRNGSEHIVKYRTSLLLGGSDTVYTIIEIGQSLNMAQKDQGAAPALFNQDPVNPAEWGFGGSWCLDSSGVDGFFRGPRPHQSSPVGNNRHVAINPSQLERLVPLREATHAGNGIHYETCASSMAHALVHGHCDVQTTTIHAVIGTGTTAIEDFRKFTVDDTFATYADRNNSTPDIDDIAFVTETQEYFKWTGIKWDRQGDHYNTILAVVSAIHDKVSTLRQNTATSTPLIHEVVIKGNQGEQNNTLGTTQTDYENEIIGFRDELTADIEAITGQSGVIFLWQQCSQLTNGELSMAGNAHANLMVTGAVRGLATHPIKPGSSGSTHMMPRTYLAWGSATAHELAFCLDDPTRKPPHALFVSKASNSATYSLNGGSGSGWQFDTDTIPAAPDGGYGYTAVDDTGDLIVTNVTITGNTIVFVFDRAIDGNLQWGFGTRHYTDGGTLMPQEYAPRVNIRDGSGWTCPQTGQVNSGFLIQHGGTN